LLNRRAVLTGASPGNQMTVPAMAAPTK